MIVPMKKVSLVILGDKKEEALIKLRRLGLVHVEISEGSGEKLVQLQEDINLIYSVLFTIGKKKKVKQKSVSPKEALEIAKEIAALDEEKKECQAQRVAFSGYLHQRDTSFLFMRCRNRSMMSSKTVWIHYPFLWENLR